MIKKGKKLYSIIYNKCPRCHEGHFFEVNNPYNLRHFTRMDKRCSVCNQNYEPEPAFYYGAMYISYGINVALFIFFGLLSLLILPPGLNIWWTIGFIITPSLLLVPVTYRIARLAWINFFVKYTIHRSG